MAAGAIRFFVWSTPAIVVDRGRLPRQTNALERPHSHNLGGSVRVLEDNTSNPQVYSLSLDICIAIIVEV